MNDLIKQGKSIVKIAEIAKQSGREEVIKELEDLQEAYNIAMQEIGRLRGLLGYDKENKTK